MVRGAAYRKKQPTSRPDHLWAEIWKICQRQLHEKNSISGLSKNRSSTMREIREGFISLIRQMQSSRKPLKTLEKVGSSDASSHALQNHEKQARRNLYLFLHSQDKICMHRGSRQNIRKSVWKALYVKIMKTTLQEKESIHRTITILCISIFLCLKQ